MQSCFIFEYTDHTDDGNWYRPRISELWRLFMRRHIWVVMLLGFLSALPSKSDGVSQSVKGELKGRIAVGNLPNQICKVNWISTSKGLYGAVHKIRWSWVEINRANGRQILGSQEFDLQQYGSQTWQQVVSIKLNNGKMIPTFLSLFPFGNGTYKVIYSRNGKYTVCENMK